MSVLSTVSEELHQDNASYVERVFIRCVCVSKFSFLASVVYFVKHHVRQTGDINYIILYKMGESPCSTFCSFVYEKHDVICSTGRHEQAFLYHRLAEMPDVYGTQQLSYSDGYCANIALIRITLAVCPSP